MFGSPLCTNRSSLWTTRPEPVDDSRRGAGGGRADRAGGDAPLPLLRIGAHRRLALSAVCDDVVVAGLICPQGLWPLSLLTEGTVVPL